VVERTESLGSAEVDKGLFSLNEQPSLNRGLSSRKQMKREYIPKTIIQFLRERKSFHENSENLLRHMTNINKITSPSPQIRPALLNVPELTLEPNDSTPTVSTPTVIAVSASLADRRRSQLRQEHSRSAVHQGVRSAGQESLLPERSTPC